MSIKTISKTYALVLASVCLMQPAFGFKLINEAKDKDNKEAIIGCAINFGADQKFRKTLEYSHEWTSDSKIEEICKNGGCTLLCSYMQQYFGGSIDLTKDNLGNTYKVTGDKETYPKLNITQQ